MFDHDNCYLLVLQLVRRDNCDYFKELQIFLHLMIRVIQVCGRVMTASVGPMETWDSEEVV